MTTPFASRSARRIRTLLVWAFLSVVAQSASAAIAYVQGKGAFLNFSNTVSVTLDTAQTAGNLNVVFLSWVGNPMAVTSLTDSAGNTYVQIGTPTVSSGTAVSVAYYAKNIAAAGSVAVTAVLSSATNYPELRVAEYSGLDTANPLSGFVGAVGTGATFSTGPLTTTTSNEVLVASAYTYWDVTSVGGGFTPRFSTFGIALQDLILSTTGTHTSTGTNNHTQWWIASMVAFKAAATDTTAPTAPGNLAGLRVSQTQIDLNWTASTDNVGVTSYKIERCTGASCTNFVQVGTSTTTTFTDTGLTGGSAYRYRVRAADAAGNNSLYSTVAAFAATIGDTTVPTSPGTPVVTSVSGTQLNLSWGPASDNVAVTAYLIQRCAGVGCTTFATIATLTSTIFATTYSNTGLTAGTTYRYRIRARDANQNVSAFSGIGTGVPIAGGDTQAPSAPTAPVATAVSNAQINVSWTASTDNVGVTGYRVERCQGAGCTTFAEVGTPATTSFTNTGLAASTTYLYRIRATDAAGNLGNYSATVSATTQPNTVQFNASSYTVGEGGGSVTITVTRAGGGSGAASVNYATSNGTATSGAGNDYTATSGTLSWTNGEVTSKTFAVPILQDTLSEGNQTINLALSGVTGATLGTPNTSVITITDDDTAPGTLQFSASGFTVSEGGTTATITVTRANGANGTVGVNYSTSHGTAGASDYVGTSGSFTWLNNDATTRSFSVSITQDITFESNETINLTLSGVSGTTLGSPATATLTIIEDETSDISPPTVPSGLTVTPGTTTMAMTWGASSDDVGVTAYSIERCQGAGCTSFVPLIQVAGTSHTDTGLLAGVPYGYRVRARDAAGNWSGYSGGGNGVMAECD